MQACVDLERDYLSQGHLHHCSETRLFCADRCDQVNICISYGVGVTLFVYR